MKKWHLQLAFLLKIIAGTALWAIYTYYYTDRNTADIFKYFDDAKIIYGGIQERPIDYLKILFGVDNDTSYFDENYYHKMMY